MSCNLDLLHIGIWTFYSGASLLVASVIAYNELHPLDKEDRLKEKNKIRELNLVKQISTVQSKISQKQKMNFLV